MTPEIQAVLKVIQVAIAAGQAFVDAGQLSQEQLDAATSARHDALDRRRASAEESQRRIDSGQER
jgi:hypothetical protein